MRICDRLPLSLPRLRALCPRASSLGGSFLGGSFLGGFFLGAPSVRASSFRVVSWAALATALAGCDGNSSVVHSARLDEKPDMLCMKRAVESVPGISHVVYVHEAPPDKPAFDEIAYEADAQRVMLMVQPDREYSQTFLRMGGLDSAGPDSAGPGSGSPGSGSPGSGGPGSGGPGSGGITLRIRRVMAQVDRAVEQVCHIRSLTRKVRETCGAGAHPEGKCPPLAS